MSRRSAQDADLVRRDHRLPGLRFLLDTDMLEEAFSLELARLGVDQLRLNYLRYKPGTNCLGLYRGSGVGGERYLYAKCYGQDAPHKLANQEARSSAGEVMLNAHHGLALFSFPCDAKLKSLSRLASAEETTRFIARVMHPAQVSQTPKIMPITYKPERRFVGKLILAQDQAVTLKLVSDRQFRRSLRLSRKVRKCEEVVLPELIGMSRKHNALAYRWVDGHSLRERLYAPSDALGDVLGDVLETGAVLARFHSAAAHLPVPAGRDYARAVENIAQTVAFLHPPLAGRVHRLARRVLAWYAQLPPGNAVIHGDFYDKQVLCTSRGVRLLDLDNLERGHRAMDLGVFMAHLQRHAISGNFLSPTAAVAEALERGYRQHSDALCGSQLDGFICLGMFLLLHHPFRDHAPEWPQKMAQMMQIAERYMDRAHRKVAYPRSTVSSCQ